MNLAISRPSFGGNSMYVRVGRARYGLPPGARHVLAARARLAWVLAPDGSVHAFTKDGEISPIPTPLQVLVREKIFGLTTAVP